MPNVIDIAGFRLTRGSRPSSSKDCDHKNLTLDPAGAGIVTCDDCNRQVSAFWALQMISEQFELEMAKLKRKEKALEEIQAKSVHLKAAQEAERAWRSRSMVPTCPNCSQPIFATDGFGGACVGREWAVKMRQEFIDKRKAKRENSEARTEADVKGS
jgi:hypothetical protein